MRHAACLEAGVWSARAVFLGAIVINGCGGVARRDAVDDGDCALGAAPSPDGLAAPSSMRRSGLFCERVGDVRSGVLAYEPRFPLWADGVTQRRFAWLPRGTSIDDADPDRWVFPVGARFWRELSVDGLRLETRLVERFGAGDDDWRFMVYAWRADGSDADPSPGGAEDARGSGHDVPDVSACPECHRTRASPVLGFSAVQLGGTEASTRLVESGNLTDLPRHVALDAAALPALGWLHGNCGHCHDSREDDDMTALGLGLTEGVTDVTATQAFRTAVGVPTVSFRRGTPRIAKGHPEESAVLLRLAARGDSRQMPPLGTKVVDPDGLAAVTAWIDGL